MIVGVGLDVCEIARMKEMLARPRFLARFFSENERDYILSRGASGAQTAAGIYAAKEAFAKSLGTGISGMELKEIGVIHDENGAPRYALSGGAQAAAAARGARNIHLSITHDGGVAAAVAIAEGDA